ncbi:unnamed protein product [Tuber melanosporum]|uniref:(Perigord truffle) hypothetical protein n=1 Tax=Tuber melanosporum (strain Mel28) TaxID=656061 RepID=D5GF87_TUBMM|nr:uncharacterized protein GSTUM_00006775001 [Tuber melanosporum]CAZ83180.1 unnamed protein product [Tuber melanosporum]
MALARTSEGKSIKDGAFQRIQHRHQSFRVNSNVRKQLKRRALRLRNTKNFRSFFKLDIIPLPRIDTTPDTPKTQSIRSRTLLYPLPSPKFFP